MNEDTLDDEVKNFSVDVEENSKVELEDPNEFIEVKVKSNVENLLFEGTFEAWECREICIDTRKGQNSR